MIGQWVQQEPSGSGRSTRKFDTSANVMLKRMSTEV